LNFVAKMHPWMSAETVLTIPSLTWQSLAQILDKDPKNQTGPPHQWPNSAWWIKFSSKSIWMHFWILPIPIWILTFDAARIIITPFHSLFICWPWLSLVSPKVFSPSGLLMEFLAPVASGLPSWGHFIINIIIDLTDAVVWELNWSGWWHTFLQNCFYRLNELI